MSQDIFREHQEFFVKLMTQLEKAGVQVESMHTEVGAGQFEVTFKPCENILAADGAFNVSNAIKTISAQHGMSAQFDAVLVEGESGNATHFNTSLIKKSNGERLFWNQKNADNLSDEAKYWMAGILEHIPGLTALCSPTAECYRRYHSTWNPHVANWDIDNSMCTLRTKNWTPSLCYVENRLPSGKANPYLVLAGTVAAGLDGIINQLPCPPRAQDGGKLVPPTLEEALDALQKDETLVKALGKEFVNQYVDHSKRENC